MTNAELAGDFSTQLIFSTDREIWELDDPQLDDLLMDVFRCTSGDIIDNSDECPAWVRQMTSPKERLMEVLRSIADGTVRQDAAKKPASVDVGKAFEESQKIKQEIKNEQTNSTKT